MEHNNTYTSLQNMNTKTNTNNKFCKVCFDAGKDESIYKSHYVKNNTTQKGVVVCPTLLP